MADLEARGLVGRTHRGGRVPVTYFLTAAALAALSHATPEVPNVDA